jgi:hypothetical protein
MSVSHVPVPARIMDCCNFVFSLAGDLAGLRLRRSRVGGNKEWIPAFAGMTDLYNPQPSSKVTSGVHHSVIPAQAGILFSFAKVREWIPAFAGMTSYTTRRSLASEVAGSSPVVPAQVGVIFSSLGEEPSQDDELIQLRLLPRTRSRRFTTPSFPRRRESIFLLAARASMNLLHGTTARDRVMRASIQ